jgi:chromosome segregation ATPase
MRAMTKKHRLLISFYQTLKQALDSRLKRWRKFRDLIVSKAQSTFQYLLSERQFRGKLEIDHDDKMLDIKVQPNATEKSKKGRETKTLSGGEKSFSTICLLLALWEAMGSPIRCLDEFDVFMDQVNRDVSMRMMIGAARRAVSRQFILITPQSMNNVKLGDDVKIHKMSDPERGQTTLSQYVAA